MNCLFWIISWAACSYAEYETVVGQLLEGQQAARKSVRIVLKNPDYSASYAKPLRHGQAGRADVERRETALTALGNECVGYAGSIV
ncbi:hypothetical protein AUG19_04800 [archaeon 13_1_20CM_2_54_9]|nr:MAG: hypothetical protein AUG19_04800 [archaeon 13_1_20CM_2_54_9]